MQKINVGMRLNVIRKNNSLSFITVGGVDTSRGNPDETFGLIQIVEITRQEDTTMLKFLDFTTL